MIVVDIIRLLADLLAYAALAIILWSIWRGTQRRAGRMIGARARWLGVPWFYLVITLLFLGICRFGWVSIPLSISPKTQTALLALGSLLYFPGLSITLWGRLALGRNYFVSSALAVRLFQDHQLITSGPYAIVRHPMYLGLIVAALGSLLIYLTWTTLFFAATAPFLMFRARREEQLLSVAFGDAWTHYCERVPMLIPGLLRRQDPVRHARFSSKGGMRTG